MLKKIVTTAGLVSVFGASTAFGVQNLSATVTAGSFASETIGAADATTGVGANLGTTFFNVNQGSGATNDLDVVMTTGFVGAPTGTNDYYVKLAVANGAFATAAPASLVVTASGARADEGTAVLFSGGLLGSSSAIYQFDISTATTATATLQANFTDLATNGNPSLSMSIFETLTEANKAAGQSVSSASGTILKFLPGTTTTITAASETAEVSTDFKKYITTGTLTGLTGELGTTAITTTAAYIAANDGAAIAATDLYNSATSVVTVTGDLSNGTWYFDSTGCATAAAIPTAQKLTVNAAKTSGTIAAARIVSNTALCNTTDGVAAIPAGSYTIAINYTPGITNTAGSTDVAATGLGAVIRNGTTNQINYLTTFADYNQRVYIGNRGTVDATYTFTFNSEAGVTATAGTAATGTSKAGTVLALKAADIVTLVGKTRTAATLQIVGAASKFDISTQQVNLSNGATDTIVYR
jgi:thiamine phosphate synthase YjbQ (UPF0047 family)